MTLLATLALLLAAAAPAPNFAKTKVAFNGGQGTQAAAYGMLKKYSDAGVLKNTSYLTVKPNLGYDVLYQNARYVLDTYKYCKAHP